MKKSIKIATLGVAALGFAAMPVLGASAAMTGDATVNVNVTSTDGITVPSPADINIALPTLTGSSTAANVVVNWHQAGNYKVTYTGTDLSNDTTSAKIAAGTAAAGDNEYDINGKAAKSGTLVEKQSTKGATLNHEVVYNAKITDQTPAVTYSGTVTYTLAADGSA